jgi:UDP-glucuronate decarboxylase
MRLLVTGGGGFIGKHVVQRLLLDGHEVHSVDLKAYAEEVGRYGPEYHQHPLNMNDTAALQSVINAVRPECAIHLAWYAAPGKYWDAGENVACVASSLVLAEGLLAAGCRRLVGVGSCAEYDWAFGYLTEQHTLVKPRGLYGVSKDAVRRILESRLAHEAMELAWARLFFLYGPGEHAERLVPSAIIGLLAGQGFTCAHPEVYRDFLDVRDVAAALCSIATSSVTGAINVASGVPTKVGDLVIEIARMVGRTNCAGFHDTCADPDTPRLLVGSNDRLVHEVGWTPRFSLSQGLADACNWWVERLNSVSAPENDRTRTAR